MIDHGARCAGDPCTCGARARAAAKRNPNKGQVIQANLTADHLGIGQGVCGYTSPDCRDGNHQKCDGAAWNLVTDRITYCDCTCGCPIPPQHA